MWKEFFRLESDSKRPTFFCVAALLFSLPIAAQELPSSPQRPWFTPQEAKVSLQAKQAPEDRLDLESNTTYTLADLIDLAESRSPETREAWQAARQRAADLHIARSTLFPSLDVNLNAAAQRNGVLLYNSFFVQELGLGLAAVRMNYTVFDANARLDKLSAEHDRLKAASFSFNDAHRRLLYIVMHSYYALLLAKGQREAAVANLASAQSVSDATQARFDHGLATLPDLSEAKSMAAQANYELQLRIGEEEKAAAVLATTLTAPADSRFQVQSIHDLSIPTELSQDGKELIETALSERPDLLQQMSAVEASKSDIHAARSQYYPTITFNGMYGELRGFGSQAPELAAYATAHVYDAELGLTWNIFDGGRRRAQVAEAQAAQKREQEALHGMKDKIESEVWQSYVDAETAFRQRGAATALLKASEDSYNMSLESYKYGVRNIVDVLATERQLALARFEDVAARVAVLDSLAQISYRTGTILRTPGAAHP